MSEQELLKAMLLRIYTKRIYVLIELILAFNQQLVQT